MRKLEDEEEILEKENQEAGSPRERKKGNGKEKERDSEGSLLKEEKDSPYEKDSSHEEKEEKDSPHEEKGEDEEEEEECPNYAAISVIRLLSLR
jgi:hypothetical protein